MRLVEYRRVSTKGQLKDGYGLAVQARDDKAWAKAAGHRIVKVCRDGAVTGCLPAVDRPGLNCCLDALAAGQADGLLVARLDRFARELTIQEATLAAVWRMGKKVFTADGGEVAKDDPDDPMRTAMRQMAGVFAQLDRSLIIKRMRDGRHVKQSMGKHATGVHPYGYRSGGRGQDSAPAGDEQAAVRRIVELRQAGQSYRQIVTALEAEGFRPRKAARWSPMTVRGIALREGAGDPR